MKFMIAQKELDELMEGIQIRAEAEAGGDSQTSTNWHARMEQCEENREAMRAKLFEEVLIYKSLPAKCVGIIHLIYGSLLKFNLQFSNKVFLACTCFGHKY